MFLPLSRSRLTGAAVVAACLVIVAGCSSDSSDSTTADGAKVPACPSASTVNDALRAELDGPDEKTKGSIRTCTYKVAPGGDQVVVKFTGEVSAADFEADQESAGADGAPAATVDGLGDAAYVVTSTEPGSEVTTVAALSDTTEVTVRAPLPPRFVEDLARQLLP